MSDDRAIQEAVDKNYAAFKDLLPELLRTHRNKFALLRDGGVVEYFDTARDAMIFGQEKFKDRLFSVQHVADVVADLGYFSHAVH